MEFQTFAEYLEKLEATSSRLEMIATLADLFKKCEKSMIDKVIYLLQGKVLPEWKKLEIGLGEKLVEQAIALATGYSKKDVESTYKETGDLGSAAEELVAKRKQVSLFFEPLTVEKVYENFMKIAKATGEGSIELKIKLLAELITNARPKEARYIVRIPLGKLRLGIGDPTILEALSLAFFETREKRELLERAYNVHPDLGYIGRVVAEEGIEGIKEIKITPGIPIRPALAERLTTPEEIIAKVGRCAVEAKYDGFRLQVHKIGDKVVLYSRRMEEMTHMFPEIIEGTKKQVKAKEAIFEGEALAYNEDTGEFYPFQVTIQRKRKYGVREMAEEYPLKLFAFDLIYVDGEQLTDLPYLERRKRLERLIEPGPVIMLAEMKVVEKPDELERFFLECIERGLEGIIAKDLNAPYIAGARKFAWIKLKRSYKGELADTIDVVILGYYKGTGKRAQLGFGGFLAGVYDKETDTFKTVAKVGSGMTEEEMIKLKQLLEPIRLEHKPVRVDSFLEPDYWVEPKYVITITADEITKSPMHTCGWDGKTGFALRFPRMVGWIRADKKPEDATSVQEIVEMYKMQKHVSLEEVK